jgi:hypothetical protein
MWEFKKYHYEKIKGFTIGLAIGFWITTTLTIHVIYMPMSSIRQVAIDMYTIHICNN